MTTLAPHQQRVVDEKNELSDRLSKLLCFFQTPIFAGLDAAESGTGATITGGAETPPPWNV